MKIVYIDGSDVPEKKAPKKIPLWKDPVWLANFRIGFKEHHRIQYEKLMHKL